MNEAYVQNRPAKGKDGKKASCAGGNGILLEGAAKPCQAATCSWMGQPALFCVEVRVDAGEDLESRTSV